MNPLVREYRRRKRMSMRLAILVIPLVLVSAGVVAPAVHSHRLAAEEVVRSNQRFQDDLQILSDLLEFKRSKAAALSEAEQRLDALVASPPLPIDLRSVLRTRLETAGATVHSVEFIETEPDEPVDEPTEELPEIHFETSRVRVSMSIDSSLLPALLQSLDHDARTIAVEQIDLLRSGADMHTVEVACDLAFLRRRPEID